MAIEFISEQHKNIKYTKSSNNLIKSYILKNQNSIVNFNLEDFNEKEALELFNFIGNHKNGRNNINDYGSIDNIIGYNLLNSLGIDSYQKAKVDLSNFPELTWFSCDWNPKIVNIGNLRKLEHFNLYRYKPKSKDLSELSTLDTLKYLKLGSGNYESLKGLDHLKNLKVLRVYNNRFVQTDEKIVIESLEELHISRCISYDYTFYKSFPNLKILNVESSNDLESLKPILDGLKNLKEVNICGTKVLEEDNTYWKDYKNITMFNFDNRKYQKLKTNDFENYPYDENGKWKGIPRTQIL